jgi:hypothetical protein
MGFLHSVVRVDCLSAAAMRRLEEWPPLPFEEVQNPAYRPSGTFFETYKPCSTMHLLFVAKMVWWPWRDNFFEGKTACHS